MSRRERARRFASRSPGTPQLDDAYSICRSQSRKRYRGLRTATLCRGVSPALRDARHHRQDRLLAIKGLYLALFVNAQHHRPIGRRQIKTDDVADFVDEQRVAGKLERLRAMRLQAESVPY